MEFELARHTVKVRNRGEERERGRERGRRLNELAAESRRGRKVKPEREGESPLLLWLPSWVYSIPFIHPWQVRNEKEEEQFGGAGFALVWEKELRSPRRPRRGRKKE